MKKVSLMSMHYFTCLLYFYSHHRCLYEYGFEKGKWTIVFWSGAEKEQSGSQFPPKSFDNLLIAATLNVTFTVTKWNTKTPPEAIMSEWCSLLQHRSAKMDVTSSAIMLKKIGPFFFFCAHFFIYFFFSIVSLSIRRRLSCYTVDSHWVKPWKRRVM